MRYFRVYQTASTQVQSPVDLEGRYPNRDFPNESDGAVHFSAKKVGGRWFSEDALRCIGGDLVVTKRLAELIRQVRIPDNFRFYSCTIDRPRGNSTDGYFVVHSYSQRFDPIDYERSVLVRAAGILVDTKVFVVDPDRLPELDLFPTVPYGWVSSERFRDDFVAQAMTGLRFIEA